jgi:hypothetical protein
MAYGYLIAGILWLLLWLMWTFLGIMWTIRIEILFVFVLGAIWHVLVTWPWECAAVAAVVTGLTLWSLRPENSDNTPVAGVGRCESPPSRRPGLAPPSDDGWRDYPQQRPLTHEQQRHIKRLQAAARRAERWTS